MALIIEAPNEIYSIENKNNIKLFLAGGITNCEDWQKRVIDEIKKYENFSNWTVYNPRRMNFPINDPDAAEVQIIWEFEHLKNADIILFWFAKGSLNPIVLYELGMHGNSSDKSIIIGVDPEYERTQDVIIQTALARPEVYIHHSLEEMILKLKQRY